MIYFHEELVAETAETIKDAADLSDICTDIKRIDDAQIRIKQIGDTITARRLDAELRKKYPIINEMLEFADTICPPARQTSIRANQTNASLESRMLQQDYYGILCHVALEKGIIQSIRQFIKSVD